MMLRRSHRSDTLRQRDRSIRQRLNDFPGWEWADRSIVSREARRPGAAAILALLALALLAAAPALAQVPRASLPDIEDEVMCPICGVTLELAAEAPQAQQEREFIRELIADGLTKNEIKDRLVAEYGPEVLASPEAEGFDLAAWLVPGVAIVFAAGAVLVAVRRWRRSGAAGEPTPQANEPGDDERLEADLARYEL